MVEFGLKDVLILSVQCEFISHD